MVSLREASPEDAAAMARIQSESLRENADEYYTDEQLALLAPAEPDAEEIPEDEFSDESCRPIILNWMERSLAGEASISTRTCWQQHLLILTTQDKESGGQSLRNSKQSLDRKA